MKEKIFTILCIVVFSLSPNESQAQLFDFSNAPVIAKLSEMLRLHRQHLLEAIRTARGVENTFRTLRDLDEYERSLRRDISFIGSLDLSRLDDLERLILFGDQSNFYLRSLSGKINSDMYNVGQLGRHGDGFLGAMDGLGLVDANIIRALFANEKTLAELGIPPQQVAAIVKELGVESTMLDLYQIKGTEKLIRALTDQALELEDLAKNSDIDLDPGQRIMMLNRSKESLVKALEYQQTLADRLKERNEKVSRKLAHKAELEAEIAELEKFYQWHSSLEHNLGFFDTEFIRRGDFK